MECLLKQEIADKNAPKLRSLINRPFPEYIKKLLKIKVGSLTESQRREILNIENEQVFAANAVALHTQMNMQGVLIDTLV